MNALNKALVLALAVLMTVSPVVLADSFPNEANPGNVEPKIYLLKKVFDICAENGQGGARPNGFDLQSNGCVDLGKEDVRTNEYAFTGEQIAELVAVRDLNGEVDILTAHMTVDDEAEVKCNDVTSKFSEGGGIYGWSMFGVNHSVDTGILQPSGPVDKAGLDTRFDKVFECILTVEPLWAGEMTVNIEAFDQSGSVSTDGISQLWFFNPEVLLLLDTNNGASAIQYESGVPGQTVYSTNKLLVTNLAEGGVDLAAYIAASDLTDPSHFAAKCPVSNVLDVETAGTLLAPQGLDYRCKVGTNADNNYQNIRNKDNSAGCSKTECAGATPLLAEAPNTAPTILYNMHTAECQFRLTYPVPCVGSFTEGSIYIIVRAI